MTQTAHVDGIQSPAVTPDWSENLVFAVSDAAAGISVWAHWSRMPTARHIWEGLLAVHLDSGEVLISRSFGPSPAPTDTASSGPLSLRCVEPGERWALIFDGMARRIDAQTLSAGPLADGPHERLTVELSFSGSHPLYSAHGSMDGQTWAAAHLEQGGLISGHVTTTDARWNLESVGFRDHSYGPRDYSQLAGDTWCTAVFPSGRAVLALQVWQVAGPPLALGFVWDGRNLLRVNEVNVPALEFNADQCAPVVVSLTTEAGQLTLEVEPRVPVWWTLDEPVGQSCGATLAGRRMVCAETPARIHCDGESTDGWLERNLRPGTFG